MRNTGGLLCLSIVLAMTPAAIAQECAGQPNGTPCTSDGVDCTDDVCLGGICEHPVTPDGVLCTDDGNDCTTDQCNAGNCVHTPRPIGAPCGDQSNTPCTNPDLCDGAGTCMPNHAADGTPCQDGLFCSAFDACCDGVCVGGSLNCPPGQLCDEDVDSCIECIFDADCNDLNPCTVEHCETFSHTCMSDPAPGMPCGSPLDTACSDPDSCGGGGDCDPNNALDGTFCDGGLSECRGGVCAPPSFESTLMPEDGVVGSSLAGTFEMDAGGFGAKSSVRRKVTPSFGTGITADGAPHATVWEEMLDGTYVMMLLDSSADPSEANAGGCDAANLCMIIGHVNSLPMAWVRSGTAWLPEDPGLPSGAVAGILMDGELHFSSTSNATPLIAGFVYDGNGRIRAAHWQRDSAGMWTSAMLPALGSNAQSRANAVMLDATTGKRVLGGGAESPQGLMMPAIWRENTAGAADLDKPDFLWLSPGMVGGEVVALGGHQGRDVAVGNVTTAGGTSHPFAWSCGSGFMGCSVLRLPSLPGLMHAEVTGMHVGTPEELVVVGTSYTVDRLTDGRATMWRVDTSSGSLLGTIDVNSMVIVGSPGSARVISLADDYGACLGGHCLTAGTAVHDVLPRGGGGPLPHIYSLAGSPPTPGIDPIPTVSQWGLLAMELLVLAAGSIVIRRRATGARVSSAAPS